MLNTLSLIKQHSEMPELYRDSNLYIDRRIIDKLKDELTNNPEYYNIYRLDLGRSTKFVGMGLITFKNNRHMGVYYIKSKNKLYPSNADVVRRD